MISRFFAFVPGVKHLVALRAASLLLSSLMNIGFVYVCVGLLSPVLRPVKSSSHSLVTSSIEITTYIVALIVIVLVKYVSFHGSCTLGAEIGTKVAMRLRPKMLRAILSLRSVKADESNSYNSATTVNDDVSWIQSWAGLLIPQIIASIPIPFIVCGVLFTVNPAIASISAISAIFAFATLVCSLLNVSVAARCVCALFAYASTAVAIISTVWLSSVKGVGLAAALLTMPLLMLSVEPLRRVGRQMYVVRHATHGLIRMHALLERVVDSEAPVSFTDDSTSLKLPDGATHVSLHVRCEIPADEHHSRARMSFIAQDGVLNIVPQQYNQLLRKYVLSGTGFNDNADVALYYSDKYDTLQSADFSPFVASDRLNETQNSSYISLCNAAPGALADVVTLVSERSHLFATTLRNNLLMASSKATTTSMWDALRQAHVDGVVYADYDGLDLRIDRIEDNHENILRRMLIARAMLRHTPVYIFDYSAENISDQESSQILSMLRRLARSATVLVLMPNSVGISKSDLSVDVDVYRYPEDKQVKQTKVESKKFSGSNDSNLVTSHVLRYEIREISTFAKVAFGIISTFATLINIIATVLIPVCTVAAMFAEAGRNICNLTTQQFIMVSVICMTIRAFTLLLSFAGVDMHHAHLHRAGISMSVGMIVAVIPIVALLNYFHQRLAVVSVVLLVIITFVIPLIFRLRSRSVMAKVRAEQHAVELEADDVELGIDEVLAYRQGERCVNAMMVTMNKLAQQNMRLNRRIGRMTALVMSCALIGIAYAVMLISQTMHPAPSNIPAWSTVYVVMAVIVLVSVTQQVVDVVLRRIPWAVDMRTMPLSHRKANKLRKLQKIKDSNNSLNQKTEKASFSGSKSK